MPPRKFSSDTNIQLMPKQKGNNMNKPDHKDKHQLRAIFEKTRGVVNTSKDGWNNLFQDLCTLEEEVNKLFELIRHKNLVIGQKDKRIESLEKEIKELSLANGYMQGTLQRFQDLEKTVEEVVERLNTPQPTPPVPNPKPQTVQYPATHSDKPCHPGCQECEEERQAILDDFEDEWSAHENINDYPYEESDFLYDQQRDRGRI